MDNSSRIIDVDINDILPNRNQPRIILNEEDDLGLTDSVKEYGVLQPIIVRPIGDKYEIIAGERRYRASVLAGKETVPVIIRNMTDKESAEVALIENVQRKELTPIEEALSYKNILDLGYMTQEQLAEKIGKSQPTIANKIRLLNLSDEVQDALLDNEISERHARSLLKIKNKKQQNEMLKKIINERLTVRKTDEEISKLDLSQTDDSEESGNKIIERKEGEYNMNNELNNMPQFDLSGNTNPAPATSQFDIFASAPVADTVAPAPQVDMFANAQPVVEATPVQEAPAVPQFDIFASAPAVEVQPVQENTFVMPTPAAPVAEPVAPQADIFASAPVADTVAPVPQVDIFANAPAVEAQPVQENTFVMPTPAAPVEPVAPVVPEMPAVEPIQPIAPAAPEMPTVEPIQPIAPAAPEMPAVEPVAPVAPAAEPVIETAPIQEQTAAPAEVKVEPIIITDYNKQYDPVMPQQPVAPTPQVNFKEVIAAIRECANKIESYGYKIDVDEFDLTNIYQAIFKIEKM